MNYLEILFWKTAIRIIKRGYGADCEETDLKPDATIDDVFNTGRCASCRAKEIIDWIESHISLLKM